ncbi:MAG: hypothetical protein L3J96_00915, partial [Thermoplasmata archaeon]|nr:hypothetical protein [Thermoplasmata archaeon]
AASSTPSSGRYGLWSRLIDHLFVSRTAVPSSPSGLLDPRPTESAALLASLGLAVLIAAYFEAVISSNPVPPGGDPGQWLSTSYAFVGLPYPSWIVPGQYPPLLFPFLGSLVLLGGGPVVGAKLYIGAVTLLIGVSTYFLGRSLFRSAMVALLVEGFVLLNPSFVNLFFFGAYPNLFGMVFLALSLAFAVRFVRSHSPMHLFLFWLATTAAVLSHSLVAVILLVELGLLMLFLFSQGRMPRQLYRSWGGAAGFGVFALGVGGFYLGTQFLGISHPAYLQTNAFAYVKNGLGNIVSLLITPFIPQYSPTVDSAYQVLVGISVFAVLVLIGLRILAPRRLTLGVLVAMIGILTVCGLALVGWQLSIVTDYVRFGYFLVLPVMLAIGVAVDRLLTLFTTPRATALVAPRGQDPAVPSPAAAVRRARLAPVALVGILGFLVLLLVTATYTAPVVNRAEQNGTDVGHDQTFLDALTSVRSSSVPGSVLTDPGAVKWTRAILDRNAYAPFIPGHYSFDTTHIADGELAYFGLTDRYAVTNSLVAASIMGTDAQFQNESGTYQASYFGLFQPLFQIAPTSFVVLVANGSHPPFTEPVTGSPVIELPPAGSSWVSLVFTTLHYRFTETVTALPGTASLRYTFEADATGSALLLSLQGNVSTIAGQTPHITGGRSQFIWFPAIDAGALTTFVNVSTPGTVKNITGYAHPGQEPEVTIGTGGGAGTNGRPILAFSLAATTPQATNLISGLPGLLSTPEIWTNWSSRFALLSNVSVPAGLRFGFLPNQAQWIETEFGAQLFATSGSWTVLLLPANPPP